MLMLNSPYIFVADMVIPFGRYCLFMWPMWFVADMDVADMVCGQYGTDAEQQIISSLTTTLYM